MNLEGGLSKETVEMKKQRFQLVGKIRSYAEAKLIRDNMLADPGGPHTEGEIQIRKKEDGFAVVLRKEVGK